MDSGRTIATPTLKGPPASPPNGAARPTLQHYRLVVRLGYGRLTEAFLATREVTPLVHEPVVVKRLHKALADDSRLARSFLEQRALLRRIVHPRIVRTLEAGVIDGQCCVAEEYLEGQPLHLALRRASEADGLPRELGVHIAICMLEGLHHAHEAKDEMGRSLGLVHGDVSPRHVFVTNDGGVKITDFSVGQTYLEVDDGAPDSRNGDARYVAPERSSHSAVDRRADVWSVGVVLWEALTGKRLFEDADGGAPVDSAQKRVIPAPSSAQATVPAALDAVVARALAWDVGERYQSALEMQHDLERWLGPVGRAEDPASLGVLMRRLFANEVVEQRRLVSVLRGLDDPTPSSRLRPPSLPPPPPPPPSGRAVSRSTNGALPTLPPPPVNRSTSPSASGTPPPVEPEPPSVEPEEEATGASTFYRSLIAIVLLCGGLSAVVTYLLIGKMREPVRARIAAAPTAAPTAMPAEPPERAAPPEVASPAPANEPAPSRIEPVAARRSPPPRQGARAANRDAPTNPESGGAPAIASVAPPAKIPEAPLAPVPPVAEEPGFLTVDTTPWSIVSENGQVLGQTPLVHLKLASGIHVLSLKNPELGVGTVYTVTIQPGKTLVKRIGIE
jgi:serine/threonine-protein kinase